MKRSMTPRRSHKIMHSTQLTYMVNNLLLGNQSYDDVNPSLSKEKNISAISNPTTPFQGSITVNIKKKDQQIKNKFLTGTSLSDFQFRSECKERKSLRPKTSVMASRENKKNQDFESKIEALKSPRSVKKLSNREIVDDSFKEKKVQVRLVQNEARYQKLSSKPPQSIKSSKPIGNIKAYTVNSHKFYSQQGQISQGRILVIANLTKSSKNENIISLFSIFQSTNSGIFADFLKDNIQVELVKLLEEPPCTQNLNKQLIQKCLRIIEQKFYSFYKIKRKVSRKQYTSTFGLSYSLIFSTFEEIFLYVKGGARICYSSSYGGKSQIFFSSSHSCRKLEKQQVKKLDFILLISEGVSISNKNLQKQIWFYLLKNSCVKQNQGQQLTTLIASVLDNLMSALANTVTSKNISMILCGFNHLHNIFMKEPNDKLQLPFNQI